MDAPLPRPITTESFEEVLRELGLTAGEAKAYRFLLESQVATSAAIARQTGLSRGKIYETLRRLVEKGFAAEEPTRPITYRPTPLQQVVGRAAHRLSQQMQALREAQVWLQRLKAPSVAPGRRVARPGDVHVFSGRRACLTVVRDLLSDARVVFVLSCGGRFHERLAALPHILDGLQGAAARGVRTRVLVPPPAAASKAAQALQARLAAGVLLYSPHAPAVAVITAVADESCLEIISQPDDDAPNKGDDIGVRIDSASYAAAALARLGETHPFQRAGDEAPPLL